MKEKENGKKGFFDEIDRRQFLKGAVKAGGMVAAWSLINQQVISRAMASEPKRGGKCVFAMSGSPLGFDPTYWEIYPDYHVGEMCYNRLVYMTPDIKAEPELAERWEPNKKADQWTFYLRKGVKFHHGRELEAKDVVNCLNHYIEAGGTGATSMSPAERWEVVDKYTLKAYLKVGYGEFPLNMAKPQTCIVPHDIPFEEIKTRAVGTGPFKFKKFVPGEYFLVERNPDYYDKEHVYLDQIKAVSIPDVTTAMSGLISGEVDIIWEIRPDQFFALKGKPGIITHQVPGLGYQNLIMDTRHKPFDDVRVRQAIKACLDREQFNEAVTQGLGKPANDQPVPQYHAYYADFPIKKQDYELAKKLLVDAGYPDGLNLTVHTSEIRVGMVESAITMKDQCAPAGINIEVKVEPADGYWKQVWRKYPFHYSNWGGRPQLYSALYNYFHSTGKWNNGHYHNPLIDLCLDEAVGETDETRAMKLYVAAQTLISDEGALIIPYLRDYLTAHSEKIHGYPLIPVKWTHWVGVWKA